MDLPILYVSSKNGKKTIHLIDLVINHNGNVMVLCCKRRSPSIFLEKTMSELTRRRIKFTRIPDGILYGNKRITVYMLGLESCDVFVDDDITLIAVDDIDNINCVIGSVICEKGNVVATSKTPIDGFEVRQL
jgi:hypothetical protein